MDDGRIALARVGAHQRSAAYRVVEWKDALGAPRREAAPMLGRSQELGLLASLQDQTATCGRGLVLSGAPGVGKSRLLAEAAKSARERGMTVLTATGVQSEAQLPFAGLHQLLRPVRAHAVGLASAQREALNAVFGLTREAATDDAAASALLDVSAPSLSTAARSRVLRESEGNPLALLELPAAVVHPGHRFASAPSAPPPCAWSRSWPTLPS